MDFKELLAYQKAFSLAMEIKKVSDSFPKDEKYALTDQIRRSSRRYINHFISKLTDSDGENSETSVWLDFALECNYLSKEQHIDMVVKSEEIGKIINYMILNPTRFGCKL